MRLVPSAFCTYEFATEQELLGAQVFTESNQAHLQNLLSQFMYERCALVFTPEQPMQYAQREAELKGQILLLQQLIDGSKQALLDLSSLSQGN